MLVFFGSPFIGIKVNLRIRSERYSPGTENVRDKD